MCAVFVSQDGEGGGKRGEEGEEVRRKQSGSVRSVGVEVGWAELL